MIWTTTIISVALVLDCADEVGGLGDPQKAIVPKAKNLLSSGIPTADLSSLISFPTSIDGDIARLFKGQDLRIFGISDFEQTRIERLEIFGFDRAPVLLATVFLESKPFNRDAIHLWLDQEYLYVALKRGHPQLLQWMIDRKILKQESTQKITEHEFLIEELIDEAQKMIQERSLPIPHWNQIYLRLVTGYEQERRKGWRDHFALPKKAPPAHLSAKAKQFAVPNPPSREVSSYIFDGWLAWDHSAVAILTYAPYTRFPGLRVALHPKLKTLYHPAFPRLDERIQFEKRFELEWLKRQNLIFVELASPSSVDVFSEYGSQILVFESEQDIPESVDFYRINPETGERLTETHERKQPSLLDE